MRVEKKATFLSADQLDEKAAARIRDAKKLPPGDARQHALKNATQLRYFAALKRDLVGDRPKAAADATGKADVTN